jgi:electron transfer flavoprotein beta subunit
LKVLVCIKRVPAVAGRITLTDDERAIDARYLGFTIGPHEECAVEAAIRLVEADDGESVALTLGPPEALEQLRDAMAMGVSRAIHLVTDGADWDPGATAAAIVEAIREDEAATGPFDLVLFGTEAADSGGYQVAVRVGYALGRPVLTGLKGLTATDGLVRGERAVTSGRDVYEVPLPAVAAVLEGLNLPRYPSVPGRLRAKSKPVATSTPSRPTERLGLIRLIVPPGAAKQATVLGDGAAAAGPAVDLFDRIGVL